MRDDPFSKLGALDQKLFTTQPPAAAPPVVSPSSPPSVPDATTGSMKQASKELRKQGSLEPRKLGTKQGSNLSQERDEPQLDINRRPDRQNTYAFTTDELERLEDLKILIRRRYDLGVTKNDLIRCAVHMLLDDFHGRGEGSDLLVRLRKKKVR
jgi:hypothetical protein